MLETAQHAPSLSGLPGHWVQLDAAGHLCEVDPALAQRLGRHPRPERVPFSDWLTPASAVLWSTVVWPSLHTRGQLHEAVLCFSATGNGGEDWQCLSHWQANTVGGHTFYAGLLTSSAERRRMMEELKQAHESLDAMPGAVLQLQHLRDGSLAFPYASNGLLDLLGVSPWQAARSPQRLMTALTPESRATLEQAATDALATGAQQWRVVLKTRQHPQAHLELAAERASEPDLWHGVLIDVTDRERLQQELRRRADTDTLTQLPNRQALLAQLGQRIAAQRRFALLFMDCDRFKQINDSLGHDAGDELLRHLAQRLQHAVRPTDAVIGMAALGAEPLAARLGGDEFVVVVDDIADAQSVSGVADRLIRTMAQPYSLRGVEIVTSVSVGVVLASGASEPMQLLRDADTAMYEAKHRGRGRWVLFEPDMHERVSQALELEGELRKALRAGQLRPVFQPIVEIATGRVVGMEALARWRHPERGDISPAQFVSVAESSGLIAELGETMLRLSCSQFAAWREQGLAVPPRLSVNLSRAQLNDRGFPQRVGQLLDEAGLPCTALQLEVTESLAMDDDSVRLALMSLRTMGVQLSLDDFGTGHSSLASLQLFPVQQVKIDRSFVREIETSAYHRALVQAALQVAHALKLEVVAEGVETAAQARQLSELGCSRAQGWLYARALEAADMPAFLAARAIRVLDGARPDTGPLASHSRAHHVVITDADGKTVHVNTAFTLNTGYTLADMLGRSPGSVLQGRDSDPRVVRLLRDAVVTGSGCLGVEIVNYRKDGTPLHLVLDIEPVRDASGRITQFISLQTEVSDRKRDQEELIDLRSRIEDVRAVGLVGFWERDLATGESKCDSNVLRMLDRAEGGPAPSWCEVLDRVTPDSRPSLERYFADLKSGGTSGLVEYSLRLRDGGLRDLQVHWSRRGERVLGMMVDASGSQRRQVRQLRLLRQIEMAAAATGQYFWVQDLLTGQVEWVGHNSPLHPTGEAGTSSVETAMASVLEQDRPIVAQARERAAREDAMVHAEFRMRAADGAIHDVLTRRMGMRDSDGVIREVVGISVDVTQQRQAERAVAAARAAAGERPGP
jgi:diguanylate cyclase (GGDEF)-like protein/PAS domain S-box-containing protein